MKGKKPAPRSRPFLATRRHHSSEAAEDYTELISELIESKGEARVGDIAHQLGVSHVTALRTIKRIQEQGYVTTSPRKPIQLTKEGKDLATFAKNRHKLLLNFFISLGIPRDVAEVDVEGAEHHISPTSLRHIENFMKKHEGIK
jgi:DtxR family manganese transport transcriptional regulator